MIAAVMRELVAFVEDPRCHRATSQEIGDWVMLHLSEIRCAGGEDAVAEIRILREAVTDLLRTSENFLVNDDERTLPDVSRSSCLAYVKAARDARALLRESKRRFP